MLYPDCGDATLGHVRGEANRKKRTGNKGKSKERTASFSRSFWNNPATLLNIAYTIERYCNLLDAPTGPLDLQAINLRCLPQSKMHAARTLPSIAIASVHLANLGDPPGFDLDPRPDRVTIRLRPN